MTDQPKSPAAKVMRSFLCEKCGAEFTSDADYKKHKVDHMQGRISDKKIDPVEGPVEEEAPLAPVVPPTPEQKAKAPWNKMVTPIEEVYNDPLASSKAQVITQVKKEEPIVLKYVYNGTCPSCNTPVETIPLDVDVDKQKKFVVIAWCSSCKKNIQQRMVTKL